MYEICTSFNSDSSSAIETFLQKIKKAGKWTPSIFLNFCMQSFKNHDIQAMDFAENITTEEYRLLLKTVAVKCLCKAELE